MDITTTTWSDFKSVLSGRSLNCQYYQDSLQYTIWAIDSTITFLYFIPLSGNEPPGSDVDQITSDRDDFETNYKPTANQPISTKQPPVVQTIKQYWSKRSWTFSHLFSDKTTWFGDAVRVENETLGTGDGSTVTFNFANQYLIDTSHGKITGEDNITPSSAQTGTTFVPAITVGGTDMVEQEFDQTGGDYTIDYAGGTITFSVPPTNGAAVIATSYFYSPANSGSTIYIRPAAGQKIVIVGAEANFSADMILTDTVLSAVYTYNPELGAPPAKFEYPGSRSSFKRMWDFINWTTGAWPAMPPFTGTRGYTQSSYQLTFEYNSALVLDDAFGTEMRIWLAHHIPFTGECGQITFYGYQP